MIRKIARGSILVGLATTVGSLLEYVYQIFMANHLPAGDFGLLNTTLSIMWMFVTLITVGIGLSIAKFISEDNAKGKPSRIMFNGLALVLALSLILSAFFLFFSFIILPKTSAFDLSMPFIVLAFITPPLAIATVLGNVFQGLERFLDMSIAALSNVITKVAAAVFLVYLGYGLTGALGAFIIGSSLSVLYSLARIRSYLKKFSINPELMKKLVVFSISTTTIILVFHILLRADVIALKIFSVPNDTIGIYTGSALIARFIYYFTISIATALLPVVSSSKKLDMKKIKKSFIVLILLFIIGNIIIYKFSDFVISLFFPAGFLELSNLLPILAISTSMLSLSYMLVTILIGIGKPKESLKPLFVGTTVYLASSAILIPSSGVLGMAYVMLLSAFVTLILSGFAVKKNLILR